MPSGGTSNLQVKPSALSLIKLNYSRPDLLQMDSTMKSARATLSPSKEESSRVSPLRRNKRSSSNTLVSYNVITTNEALVKRIEGISRRKSEHKFPLISIKSARNHKTFEEKNRIDRENKILWEKIYK